MWNKQKNAFIHIITPGNQTHGSWRQNGHVPTRCTSTRHNCWLQQINVAISVGQNSSRQIPQVMCAGGATAIIAVALVVVVVVAVVDDGCCSVDKAAAASVVVTEICWFSPKFFGSSTEVDDGSCWGGCCCCCDSEQDIFFFVVVLICEKEILKKKEGDEANTAVLTMMLTTKKKKGRLLWKLANGKKKYWEGKPNPGVFFAFFFPLHFSVTFLHENSSSIVAPRCHKKKKKKKLDWLCLSLTFF